MKKNIGPDTEMQNLSERLKKRMKEVGLGKNSQKLPHRSMKTDITTARGVQLTPFQAWTPWYGPPLSSYVMMRLIWSNGGSVVSNVRKLVWAKSAKKTYIMS